MKWLTTGRILVFTVWLFVCGSGVNASADTLYRFRSGVHLSQVRPLFHKQRTDLLNGLRAWTGLCQLEFDHDGNLVPGDRTLVTTGSETARALIIQAVDSSDSFVIEQFNNSSQIAFAQVEDTDRYVDGAGRRHIVWEIRIDFTDFQELTGDDDARASFDPVASFVHELTHAVKGYVDSVGRDDQLGECEAYVNIMRVELGLPKRIYYFPIQRRATKPDGVTFVQGELSFAYEQSVQHDAKEVLIKFNVEKVFDLSSAKSRSQIEANLIAQKRTFR